MAGVASEAAGNTMMTHNGWSVVHGTAGGTNHARDERATIRWTERTRAIGREGCRPCRSNSPCSRTIGHSCSATSRSIIYNTRRSARYRCCCRARSRSHGEGCARTANVNTVTSEAAGNTVMTSNCRSVADRAARCSHNTSNQRTTVRWTERTSTVSNECRGACWSNRAST